MQLQVVSADSSKKAQIDVSEEIFGHAYNEALVHQVVTAYMAAARQGTRAQKTRAQVRGGGKKPWKQKGTGRARAGSIRSPIWVGGGRAHPATPNENFQQKVNKKMYRGAIRSILSELVRQDRLVVVQEFVIDEPKTKLLLNKLNDLSLKDVLIVTDNYDEALILASRNLYHVDIQEARTVDPISLVGYQKVLMTAAAIKELEERLV